MPETATGKRPRVLLVEKRSWNHYEGLFLTLIFLGGGVLASFMVGTLGNWTALQRLALAVPIVGLMAGPAVVFYPMSAMRGAVWEDGFRPSSSFTSMGTTAFLGRGLRGKIRWGEVERFTARVNKATGAVSDLRVLLSQSNELSMGLGGRKSESSAEFVLLVLERWRALGGIIAFQDGKPAGWDEASLPSEPRAAAADWESFRAADRVAWQRHEATGGEARREYARSGASINRRGLEDLMKSLDETKIPESRYRRFLQEERKIKERIEEEMGAPSAAYVAASKAAFAAYQAAMPGIPAGHRPLWMPPTTAMPDEAAAMRRADEHPWNNRWLAIVVTGIAAACLGPAAAAAAAGDWTRVGLWGSFALLCMAPLPVQVHLSGEKDSYIVQFPRRGPGQRRVLEPGRGAFNNPFRYRAVRFSTHEQFCFLQHPAQSKDGEPFEIVGLLAFELDQARASLERAADFLVDEKPTILSEGLRAIVRDKAAAEVALHPAVDLRALDPKVFDAAVRREVEAIAGQHGFRLKPGGAIAVVPEELARLMRAKGSQESAAP